MVERRLAFVGQTNNDPIPFIAMANLEYAGHLPDETPRNKLYFLANIHNLALEEKSKEPKPLWAIEDRPEELLQAAHAMLKDPNDTSKQSIKNLCGALILVKLEEGKSSFTVDRETGIRVVGLMKGQFVYPMHPTPNS